MQSAIISGQKEQFQNTIARNLNVCIPKNGHKGQPENYRFSAEKEIKMIVYGQNILYIRE
jgi:hypothetical protein